MQFLLPGQKFFFQYLLCRFQIAALDIPSVITVQAQHIKEIADGIGVSVAEHYIDAGDRTRRVEFTRCFRQWPKYSRAPCGRVSGSLAILHITTLGWFLSRAISSLIACKCACGVSRGLPLRCTVLSACCPLRNQCLKRGESRQQQFHQSPRCHVHLPSRASLQRKGNARYGRSWPQSSPLMRGRAPSARYRILCHASPHLHDDQSQESRTVCGSSGTVRPSLPLTGCRRERYISHSVWLLAVTHSSEREPSPGCQRCGFGTCKVPLVPCPVATTCAIKTRSSTLTSPLATTCQEQTRGYVLRDMRHLGDIVHPGVRRGVEHYAAMDSGIVKEIMEVRLLFLAVFVGNHHSRRIVCQFGSLFTQTVIRTLFPAINYGVTSASMAYSALMLHNFGLLTHTLPEGVTASKRSTIRWPAQPFEIKTSRSYQTLPAYLRISASADGSLKLPGTAIARLSCNADFPPTLINSTVFAIQTECPTGPSSFDSRVGVSTGRTIRD
uniref:Tyrosine kinase n=1 Tax=Phytophthora capsici TaxID=4784 RepID=Q01863_PHYCP|nr:tyrosine kinase [Phytophthora capsici]